MGEWLILVSLEEHQPTGALGHFGKQEPLVAWKSQGVKEAGRSCVSHRPVPLVQCAVLFGRSCTPYLLQ